MTVKIMTSELLQLIATADWRPFDTQDFYGFAGVMSESPLIADAEEFGDQTAVFVLDGAKLSIHLEDGTEHRFDFGSRFEPVIEILHVVERDPFDSLGRPIQK
jgi:hypothetical protein